MPDYPETPKGPLPGSQTTRNRRREPLPKAAERTQTLPGTPLVPSAPAPAPATTADGDLQVTRRQKLPEGKVLGLNVSQSHYDRGTLLIDVLAAKYGMNKRQVAELIVMFLDAERFRLSEYVERFSERAVDLDYLSRPSHAQPLDEPDGGQQAEPPPAE